MFYIGENSMGGFENNNKEVSYSESNNYENNFFSYNNKSQNQNKPTNFVLKSSENKQPEDLDGKLSPQEKVQETLNKLKTGTPEEVENIIKATPVEMLALAYKNPQYLKGFRSLPLDNKIAIIESLGENKNFLNAVRQGNQVDTDIKITIKDGFLNKQEKKTWLKKIILSGKENSESNLSNTKNKISNYFRVVNIVENFGYDRESAAPSFAKRALSPDEKYEKTAEQNEKIRNWFLNKMLDVSKKYSDIVNTGILEKNTLDIIKNYASDKGRLIGVIEGLSTLEEEQQKKINSWSDETLKDFLNKTLNNSINEKKIGDMVSHGIEARPANEIGMWFTVANNKENILSSVKEISRKGLTSAISEENQRKIINLDINSSKKDYSELSKDEEAKSIYILAAQKAKKVVDESDEKGKGSKLQREIAYQQETQKQLRLLLNTDNLPEEQQKEVNKTLDSVFEKNNQELLLAAQKNGFTEDLKQVRGTEYYTKVEQRYINTQTIESKLTTFDIASKIPAESQQAWKSFGGKILENKVLEQEENKLDTLPDVSQKDLQKFKPIPSEYQKFIGSDGLLDKNLMDQNKIPAEKQQELLNTYNPEKTKNQLLQETNDTIKTQFTQQVVQFLQQSLNIQIDDQGKENILEQFNDIQNTMDSQNIIIEGNYQGQKMRFVYDLTTGDLQTNDWMSKDRRENNLKINSSSSKSLGIFGPNIKDTIDNAKVINYADIIQKSQGNIENYTQYCKQELSLKNPTPRIENQDVLKKQYLKTILNQEMIDLIGLQKPEQQKEIDLNKYPIYNQIYQSVENYDIEELQEMRENIQQMKQLEDQITGLSENNKLLAQETDNPAKKILLILFKEQKLEQQKTPIHRFGNHFLHFFNAMKTLRPRGEERIKIIDPRKIKTFLADVQESSAGEKYPYDKELLKNEMSPYLADIDLDEQLENIA